MRPLRWLLLTTLFGLTGCASIAAQYIEHPGHDRPSAKFVRILEDRPPRYTRSQFRTSSGVRIAYWYGKPQALHITETLASHRGTITLHVQWRPPKHPRAAPRTRGTVVLLHSWGLNALQMVYWALHFTNAGYVVVMPDLRDQGDSGNAPVGYGPREAGDIQQLIEALSARHELPAPTYLFGYSYGATVALFTAPRVPGVRGVIAMAPYVHPAAVIERAPQTDLFTPGWWPAFLPPAVLRKLFSPHVMDAAIARADGRLGINLFTLDPDQALIESHACTLVLRGNEDRLTSRRATESLARESRRAQFVAVPHANHVTLFLRTGPLFRPLARWMAAIPAAADAACPAFAPANGTRRPRQLRRAASAATHAGS